MKLHITLKKVKGKGFTVVATKNFAIGDIIERCPVLILTPKERKQCEKTTLTYYIYPWKSEKSAAVVLGYGSLINHSYTPNTDWIPNFKTKRMIYKVIKTIKKGQEITVNYNGEPGDLTPIDWFKVR